MALTFNLSPWGADTNVFHEIKEEINFLILESLETEGIHLVGPVQATPLSPG